jgi:hypothetical protein
MIRSNEGSEDRNEFICKLGPLSEASRPELHTNITTWMARLSAGRRRGSRVSAACFSHSSRAKSFYAFPLSAPLFGPCDITGLWHVMPIFTEPQTRLWPQGVDYSGIDWLSSRFPRFLWLLWPSVKQHVAREAHGSEGPLHGRLLSRLRSLVLLNQRRTIRCGTYHDWQRV